jgi:hypothetical protein
MNVALITAHPSSICDRLPTAGHDRWSDHGYDAEWSITRAP